MSLNHAIFHGRLGNNPEITTMPNNKERVRFSIAVDRDYKDQDGNRPTDWHPVTIWGSAEYIRKTNLAKGDSVIVSGRMENNTWIDNNGIQHKESVLNCNKIYLTAKNGNRKSDKDQAAEAAFQNTTPQDDDDLPF
jgi:single-strand DNA-binding protein